MSKLFDDLMEGLDEAHSYMEGNREGFKVHVPEAIDVRSIRTSLHLTQNKFAARFGLSADAVKNWESGRRIPEASARALLAVIAHAPEVVVAALGNADKIAQVSIKRPSTLGRPKATVVTAPERPEQPRVRRSKLA